eukprot:747966-Hanusia_phi.AAC.2
MAKNELEKVERIIDEVFLLRSKITDLLHPPLILSGTLELDEVAVETAEDERVLRTAFQQSTAEFAGAVVTEAMLDHVEVDVKGTRISFAFQFDTSEQTEGEIHMAFDDWMDKQAFNRCLTVRTVL